MTNLEALADAPVVDALGRTLLHFLWQGALLGLAAAAALAALRGRTPQVRYGVACVALLAMFAAPIWTFASVSTGELSTNDAIAVAPDAKSTAADDLAAESTEAEPTDLFVATIDALWGSSAEEGGAWLSWLVALWLCGVAVLGFRAFGGWLGLRRLGSRGLQPLTAAWQDRIADLTRRLGVTRPVCAVESTLVSGPAVLGWWRPLILVPCSALMRLTPEQLEAVLAHELAHIRRHDYLVNLAQTAVETLLFYHPAVWWLSRRIRHERELCCDDIAASCCGDPIDYARALAELEGCRHPAPLALAAGGSDLMARVRRLAGLPSVRSAARRPWSTPAVLGLTLVLGWGNHSTTADESEPPEPPVVAVSADGKLVQVPIGIPVVLRDARGARVRDGGVLLVVTSDQQLTLDEVPCAPGSQLPRDRQLLIRDAHGRVLWTFERVLRGEREVVELSHHTVSAPLSPSSTPRNRKP